MKFKDNEYDVLISSTIIENGIDLPNANTLIVHNADELGLSQLYQLRGRVGRGRTQAYCYLLYSISKLPLDAKKRLRAIVEASELGSGFQIAMRDLEIRGAGDILGSSQHGMINSVGVSHFIRLLNQAIEDIKQGKYDEHEGKTEVREVVIELPLTSYIPDYFISDYEEKINVYQKLSGVQNRPELKEFGVRIQHEYGKLPEEVTNLFRVLDMKLLAKERGLSSVRVQQRSQMDRDVYLGMTDKIRPEHIFQLLQFNDKWMVSGDKLKIDMKHLGLHWYKGLWDSIQALKDTRSEKGKEKPKEKK
jgi:transcription-repair coupling factor (superfamily II helicase)